MVVELSTQDNLEYTYHPVPSRTLRFKVKASNDAHILLSANSSPSEADPVVEIFIGGWSNAKSAIRRDRTRPDKANVDTPDILNGSEFRGFWINYTGGLIEVGKENESAPFISFVDPNPVQVAYFGVSTGYGATGEWIIEDTPDIVDPPVAAPAADIVGISWVPSPPGTIPPNAVLGGFDNENLYVGRAPYEGALLPGKILLSHGVCYIPWGGAEHGVPEYEALVGTNAQWVQSVDGVIPPNAIPGGNSEDGETLFIGRAQHEGTTPIGKVQPSHKVCYIPFGGQELAYPEYEILIAV